MVNVNSLLNAIPENPNICLKAGVEPAVLREKMLKGVIHAILRDGFDSGMEFLIYSGVRILQGD